MTPLASFCINTATALLIVVFIYLIWTNSKSIAKKAAQHTSFKSRTRCIFQELETKTTVILSALAILVAALFSVASLSIETSRSLMGQLTCITFNKINEDRPELSDNGVRFIASIQNSGNNPISIQRVYVVVDGKELDLQMPNKLSSQNNTLNYFSNVLPLGQPVDVGKAVRIPLTINDNQQQELEEKSITGCYVEDTLNNTYELELTQPYATAEYAKTNEFTLAPN